MPDYSQAPTEQVGDYTLIPDGTLAWASFIVRPFNLDQGLVEKPTNDGSGKMLDCELAIDEGPYTRRKLWHMIYIAGPKEKGVNMGGAQVRAILECGRGAGPQNPAAYQVSDDYREFWAVDCGAPLRVGIKIGIEKGGVRPPEQGGGNYPDKNKVSAFLSPNPESSHNKDYQKLLSGQQDIQAVGQAVQQAAAQPQGWGATQPQPTAMPQGGASAPAPQGGKPGWLQNQPQPAPAQPQQAQPQQPGTAPAGWNPPPQG